MLLMLAQAERDRALAEGYLLIFWIALVGLIGIVLMLLVFLNRRMARRRLRQIEQDKIDRRAAQSTPTPSAWQQSAERYVDHDKLPEDVPYDSEPDATELQEDDEPGEDDAPPPGWEGGGHEPDPDDEPDPYGLFEDKPYRDPEDDDEADDNGDTDIWDVEDPDRPG